jgi:hypothetical protein
MSAALGHERKKLRAHAWHVRGEQDGVFAENVLETDPRARQRAFIRDRVTRE